jgi:type IV pilus assembly protein PilF
MISRLVLILAASVLVACLGGCKSLQTQKTTKNSGDTTSSIAEINTKLGVAHMREGNLETAMKKLEIALNNDANYPDAHHAMAVLHERLGQDAKAEEYYKKSIDLMPDFSRAMNDYGRFLCTKGKASQGQAYFAKALQNPLYDNRAAAHTNSGICYLQQHDSSHAEQSFRAALQANPQYGPAMLQMARILFERSEYLQTRAYLQRFGQAGAHNAQSLWLGVRTERQLGNRDAEGSYALLLKNKFPDSQETRLMLESQPR